MKTKPTLQTRRKFLRTSMLGAAAPWTIPVALEMAGGNDGLNMVVPSADDAYHVARPRLRLSADQVLKIDNHIALNPKLTGLKSLYDEGHVAIVQGVGYPNPNRSHFRST